MPRPLSLSLLTLGVAAALAIAFFAVDPRSAIAQASCDPSRSHPAGDTTETLTAGGFDREYILHIPPSYDGSDPVPLVLNLHGLGSHAREQMDYSELAGKADEEGFIVVAPQGTVTQFIPSRHWNFTTLEAFDDTPDDVAFIDALLDHLEEELCVDPARVYVAGMSNGAQMAVRLACDLAGRIAAISAIAGVYYPPAFEQVDAEPDCNPSSPVPVIAFHGTEDRVIQFEGGALGLALPFDTRHIETEVMPDWAERNGCDQPSARDEVTDNVTVLRYQDCDAGVELYVIESGRHEWPGSSTGFGSPQADEVSANDLMWEFFQGNQAEEEEPSSLTSTLTSGWSWGLVGAGAVIVAGAAAGWGILRARGKRSENV
jgi:polyhydroxybutyrate depolymerase